MAQKKAAWGIDIGQSSLKAIKLQYSESTEQVVATAFDYIPYPKILSQPDAIPEEIVADSMKTFLSRNQIENDLVAIAVPGHSSLARFIQLPPVESSKLAEIVKYEARQQIPFALEEVIWDFQPLGAGVEESGYLLDAEVGLFAMKRDQVYNAMRPYTSNKIEVELIQIAPLALYNVLSYDELGIKRGVPVAGRDEYTIILDMGCDNTTLMISNGGKIWIRNVPIGGNHFTRALTKEMKLSFAKAEHLKCNATKSPDPRAVFQALRPVFNDYVSEIQRSIGYFSSVNRQAKVSKVVGLGNGFKLAGLQKFLQQNLQYEVEKPDSFKSLAGDSVVNAPLFSDNILSFAVPYGLALQTLEVTRIHTTLLPPEIASARLIRRKKPWAVVTAAGLLVGASLGMTANSFSYARVHSEPFAAAEKDAKAFEGEVTAGKSAYDAETAKREAEKAKLKAMVVGRRSMDWMEIFNAINDCLPRDENSQEEIPLDKRNQLSISYIGFAHEDPATWFEGLTDDQKYWMTKKDLEAAPAGPGYLVTLVGKHWHNIPGNPDENEVLYLKNHFLNNLQSPTVMLPGYLKPRDVGRMGVSHATIMEFQPHDIYVLKGNKAPTAEPRIDLTTAAPKTSASGATGADGSPSFANSGRTPMGGMGPLGGNTSRYPGAGSGYSSSGSRGSGAYPGAGGYPGSGSYPGSGRYGGSSGGYGPGGMSPGGANSGGLPPGANPDDYDKIPETDFMIQFFYKPTPKEERQAESSEGGATETGAAAGEKPADAK